MKSLLDSREYNDVLAFTKTMDWANKDIYSKWLAQTYYFVCHSTRLLAQVMAKVDVDDPVSKRMISHISEENGHHLMAKKDLKNLGFDISDFEEYGITKAFYESQYYKILFRNPNHFFGYVFMLEALAVDIGAMVHRAAEDAHGNKSSVFIKVHANEDPGHVESALKTMEQLSEKDKEGIKQNFTQTCELYLHILKAITE